MNTKNELLYMSRIVSNICTFEYTALPMFVNQGSLFQQMFFQLWLTYCILSLAHVLKGLFEHIHLYKTTIKCKFINSVVCFCNSSPGKLYKKY